jgi:hypothetical protein
VVLPDAFTDRVEFVSMGGHHRHVYEVAIEHLHTRADRHTIAVCVKPMLGHFRITRLLEWFEIQRTIGIKHFIVYIENVSNSVHKVVNYYKQLGHVTTHHFRFLVAMLDMINATAMSGSERYSVRQQSYILAYHDCMYRYRGTYKHLAFYDLDEVLLPVKEETIDTLLHNLHENLTNKSAAYVFRVAWHFEEQGAFKDAPPHLYMQRFPYSNRPVLLQQKVIVLTDRAISLNFHGVLRAPDRYFLNYIVSSRTFAYLHHYRGWCRDKFSADKCKDMLSENRMDHVIPRYKSRIEERVRQVLRELNQTTPPNVEPHLLII